MTRSNRRTFLKRSAALSAGAALGFPAVVRAQSGPVKIGVLHPVTGFLAYSGNLCRLGAQIAIDEINAGGGIKSLGGAKLQAVLGDAQSKPEAGVSEVEKMNEEGVSAIVGAYASAICLATSQAAAKYSIPNVVDVGVADQIVERGLKNTFRFGPGYRVISESAINDLHVLNTLAGKPLSTVMIVHEESLFGTGTANLLASQLPGLGYKIVEVVKHANPTRDFSNIVLRMKALNPDILIPANYYNEYALLLRTMKQQAVAPRAIYSVFLNYQCVHLLADAIERAKSRDRAAIIDALAASTWDKHFMPYGPTKFVNGQNTGARPLVLQVLRNDIKVVLPKEYREADPVFPWKA